MALVDAFGRRITYLRISVTDRCNFRCTYCMPKEGVQKFARENILSFEELERIVTVGVKLGIERARITGGEPLVRKGLPDFIRRVNAICNIKEITLTTNGALLEKHADELKRAGLKRINISLDTLNPEKFARVTRGGILQNVLDGICAANDAGITPIKLNTILMKGVNDGEGELEQLAGLTALGYHVRFIELMPLEHNALWRKQFLPAEIAKKRLEKIQPLVSLNMRTGAGPAMEFQWGESAGRIGFIEALSCSFCGDCNRLRLSADGKLFACLFSQEHADMRAALRKNESGDEMIENAFYRACGKKPEGHGMSQFVTRTISLPMAKIGG